MLCVQDLNLFAYTCSTVALEKICGDEKDSLCCAHCSLSESDNDKKLPVVIRAINKICEG